MSLRDMTPNPALFDVPHSGLRDSIISRDVPLDSIVGTDGYHVGISEFGFVRSLATSSTLRVLYERMIEPAEYSALLRFWLRPFWHFWPRRLRNLSVSDVLPTPALPDAADRILRNAIVCSDRFVRRPRVNHDLFNKIIIKLGQSVSRSTAMTVFCHRIMCVYLGVSEKQVRRIAAAWYVATMKNIRRVWYRSIFHLPRYSVRSLMLSLEFSFPVTVAIKRSHPNPATTFSNSDAPGFDKFLRTLTASHQ